MYSTGSTSLLVATVVLTVVATIAVALRFTARSNKQIRYGADDWTILAALLSQFGAMAVNIFSAVAGGVGDSRIDLAQNPEEFLTFQKLLFAGPLIFAVTITLVKISILLMYKRIFVTTWFHHAVNIVMALVLGWFLAAIFGTIFKTNPVQLAWEDPTATSFNYNAYLLALAALNLCLDLTILALPLFVVRTLHMTFNRKAMVLGIFWLGAFCVVASIVRLYYFVILTQGQDAILQDYIWSAVEPCASMIAACLPTLAPLLRKDLSLRSIFNSMRSAFSLHSGDQDSLNSVSQLAKRDADAGKRKWRQLQGGWDDATHISRDGGYEMDETHADAGNIRVERQVHVSSAAT